MARSGTSESRSLTFAPGFVTSARLPVDQVKAIVLPVGRLGSIRRRARTPYSRYRSRRSFAFASDPTAPMNVVEAPRLDIWSAKFVAFPPGNGSKRGTSACTSPGAKSSIGGVTKSTIPSPIATTRGGREPILTPAKVLVASTPRPRACSPPADRIADRTDFRAHRGPDRALPIRSSGTPHPLPTSSPSEEILERELLVGPPRRFRLQGRFAEVVARQRLLLRPLAGEEGLFVPAVDLGNVGERLRDATRIVLPVRPLLELRAGKIRLDLHRGLLVVRHDPRDLHPRHELLAHLLELARRDDVAHRIRVHVLVLLFDGAGDHEHLDRVFLRVRERWVPVADLGDDPPCELDGSVRVVVEDLVEHEELGLALEVERVRPADFVASDHDLAFRGPRDLPGVPLLPPMAEQAPVDLVHFHADPPAREPLRGLPRKLQGRFQAGRGRLEEHRVRVRVHDLHAVGLEFRDDPFDPFSREGGDRGAHLWVVEPIERRREDAVERVHEDLDRRLEAVVELPHLGVRGPAHLRPHVFAVLHEARQDHGKEPFLHVGGEELRTSRALDRPLWRYGREADVVLDDQGWIHRAEVERDDPLIQAGLQAVHVAAFNLFDAAAAHLHHRDRDEGAVCGADQNRVYQVRGAPVEHILERELAHGGQVQGLLDATDLLEDPEREIRVIQTISYALLTVLRPFLVDMTPRELVFSLTQQLAAHVVERLLLHVQAQALRPHGPPHIRQDAAVDPPEALAEVEEVREVACELKPRNPVLRGAIDEDGQVVAVDVVSRDDVRVELMDELDEPLYDLPLAPLKDEGLDLAGLAVRDADAEDVSIRDAVLDVEGEHPQSRAEGVARFEAVRDEEQVGRVSPGRIRLLPVDPDRGAEIHVVDEPMLKRDVGLQGGGPVPPGLLAVFGGLPGLAEDDPGARSRLTFELERHVFEFDDLRIPPERSAERLRGFDDEEVRPESRVLDRDTLPFPCPSEQLNHGQLRLLGAVPWLAPVRGRNDAHIIARHLTPLQRS